jgi:hypothetical protein
MRRALSLMRSGPVGWLLATRMLGWRVALPLLRRRMGLTALVELAAHPHPHSPPDVAGRRRALRLAHALFRSTEGTCLERSLLLFRYLGRAGAAPELVVGFTRHGDGVVGHAWVEVERAPVLEAGDPSAKYVSLVRFGPDGCRVGSDAGPVRDAVLIKS